MSHEHKTMLHCNCCKRDIDKHSETVVLNEQVCCLICGNWLCGFEDAFGKEEETVTKGGVV